MIFRNPPVLINSCLTSHAADYKFSLTIYLLVYSNIGKKYPEEWASTILAIVAIFVTSPVYYFYRKGPQIRMHSKFAQQVAKDREKQLQRRKSKPAEQQVEQAEKPRGPAEVEEGGIEYYRETGRL